MKYVFEVQIHSRYVSNAIAYRQKCFFFLVRGVRNGIKKTTKVA